MGAHVQLFTTLATAHVRWRLLSGNNRELGRGAVLYPDTDAAIMAIEQSRILLAQFQCQVRRVVGGHWRWELLSANVPHIESGRQFDRQIRCEQGLAQFMSLFTIATISDNVMISGSRRGRG